MFATSLKLACLLLPQSGEAPAPLRDIGPATIEVRCVDLAGETVSGVEWRYAFEDENELPIADERVPGGFRQGMRFDYPPLSGQVDLALRGREWSSSGSGPKVELQPERGLLVEARRKDHWGFLWLPRDWRTTVGRAHPEGAALTLELARDWDLHVRVEDAGGRPTTAHVGLRCETYRFEQAEAPEEYVFRHVGYVARHARDALVARLHELLEPPVETRIDPHHAPAGPVVLRMPATGGVELHVQRSEERRHLDATVSLTVASTGETRMAIVDKGVARFDHVGLGLRLVARLQAGAGDRRVELEGPRWAGDVVAMTLEEPVPEPRPVEDPLPLATGRATPMASVAGFLLLDPGIPIDQLELSADDPFGTLNGGMLHRDGKFEFHLPAGRTRFEVRPKGIQEFTAPELGPAFRLDVELEPGDNEVAALSVVDLRGKFFAHTVRLEGVNDVDLRSARVLFGPRAWPRSRRGYCWLSQPPLTIVSLWPRVDLELYVPGYRTIELLDVEREREVAPAPGIPIELRLAPTVTPPAPPFRLAAMLQPPERLMRVNDWEAPAFVEGRSVTTTAYGPGKNQVVWLLKRGSKGSCHVTTKPQFVHVLDSTVRQVFHLELPPEELARWLAEAR